MSYVRKVLLPGEQVVYETGLHPILLARPVLLLVAALVPAIGAFYVQGGAPQLALLALAAAVAFIGVVVLIAVLLRRAGTELAVTDQRVVYKRGLISRHTIEMNRGKVESVDVDQSLWGRLFGYGTVQVRGTGGSLEPMAMIRDPIALRSCITAEPVRTAPRPGAGATG
ncbi:MAG TPA: PH domain-containing protein [Stellaceae bacterium]|nr:PH domain-containing protein [Stellaceae bacterium]